MDATDLTDLVHFDEDAPHRTTLAETERLWAEVVCLERAQEVGPARDADADALCTILAGEVAVQVGRRRKRLKQWAAFVVPAGSDLFVRNASEEPAVLLLVTAPPPSASAGSAT